MTNVLIITADGCTPDLDYAVFRLREEQQIKVTVAAPKRNVCTASSTSRRRAGILTSRCRGIA